MDLIYFICLLYPTRKVFNFIVFSKYEEFVMEVYSNACEEFVMNIHISINLTSWHIYSIKADTYVKD